MKTELGKKYRDKVSGYEGVAVCRGEWLYGCVRVTLNGGLDKDGQPQDCVFDEDGLEEVEAEPVTPSSKRTGGDHPAQPREGH